jgi:hypothetical protein
MKTGAESSACTLSISFHGIPFAIGVEVSESTASHMEALLTQHCSDSPEQLMQISDVEGRQLLLNTAFIKKLIFVDWFRGAAQEDSLSSKQDDFDHEGDLTDYPAALRIYFSDGTEPVSHCDISGIEMESARCLMDTYDLKDVPMFSFHDEDDDLTFVNPRKIVFMEYSDMRTVKEFLEQQNVYSHYIKDRESKFSVDC